MSEYTNRFYPEDVIGRTVIIHEKADDFHSQPSGDAGEMIACGEIVAWNPELTYPTERTAVNLRLLRYYPIKIKFTLSRPYTVQFSSRYPPAFHHKQTDSKERMGNSHSFRNVPAVFPRSKISQDSYRPKTAFEYVQIPAQFICSR